MVEPIEEVIRGEEINWELLDAIEDVARERKKLWRSADRVGMDEDVRKVIRETVEPKYVDAYWGEYQRLIKYYHGRR